MKVFVQSMFQNLLNLFFFLSFKIRKKERKEEKKENYFGFSFEPLMMCQMFSYLEYNDQIRHNYH